MALLFNVQVVVGNVTHAHRSGDDHRQTGAMGTSAPGTTASSVWYIQPVQLNYVGSDGNPYTDTLPASVAARVWTHDPKPVGDIDHVGNYVYSLSEGATTFDQRAARWKAFAPAMYGGATHLFVARSADFNDAVDDLASYIPPLVPANIDGDVLPLQYVNTAGFVRPLEGGCDVCGAGVGKVTLQLVAGLPDLVDLFPQPPGFPPNDPENYPPAPGYDDALGDPLTCKLAGPSSLLRTEDGTLYIGCSSYSSLSGPGVYDHAQSATIRRIKDGVIDTVAGIGDIGLLGNPSGTVYPNTGDPLVAQLATVTAMLFDEDTQVMDFHGLGRRPMTTVGTDFGATPDDGLFDACNLQLRGTLSWATTETNHGAFTGIGAIGANLAAHPHGWEMTASTPPWDWFQSGLPTIPAPFSYLFGTSLQRTSTGRLLSDGSPVVIGTEHMSTGGDENTFASPYARLARIDDISGPVVGDMVWAFDTILGAIDGTTTSGPSCHGQLVFDLKQPQQMWLDQTGPVKDRYLYVACAGNNQIRIYDLVTNTFTLLVGDAGEAGGYQGDGQSIYTDPATLAPGDRIVLASPTGVCLDSKHRLCIAGGGSIRRVDLVSGIITTIAGIGGQPGVHQWKPGTPAQIGPPPVPATGGAIIPGTALKLGPALRTQINPNFLLPGKNCGLYFTTDQRVLYLGCGKPLKGGN